MEGIGGRTSCSGRTVLLLCYNGPMNRSHVVISGTGRAGTTFLVQLLTHLGLNTGFDIDKMEVHPIARAGLEMNIRDENAPYIVKTPSLCDSLEDVLASSVR